MQKQTAQILSIFIIIEFLYTFSFWIPDLFGVELKSYFDFIDKYYLIFRIIFSAGMAAILFVYFNSQKYMVPWIIYLITKSLGIVSSIIWSLDLDYEDINFEMMRFLGIMTTVGWATFYGFVAFGKIKHWGLMAMGITGLIVTVIPFMVYQILKIEGLYDSVGYLGIFATLASLLWIPVFMDATSNSNELEEDEYGQYRK